MVHTTEKDRVFTDFVTTLEPRLSYALAMAYGPEIGRDATANAFAYAWEHWERVSGMDNAAGYLFRVGQSKARRYFRKQVHLPAVAADALPDVEPGLPAAMEALSTKQRVAVVLIHGQGYSDAEAAEVMGVARGTARKHAERGLDKLQRALGVTP